MAVSFQLTDRAPCLKSILCLWLWLLEQELSWFSGFRKKGQVMQTNVIHTQITKLCKILNFFLFGHLLLPFQNFCLLLLNFNNRGRGKVTICKICKLHFEIETLLFSEKSPFSTFKSVGILCSLHVVCSSIRGHCISNAIGQAVCKPVLMLGGCRRWTFSVCVLLMSEKRERICKR